MKPYEVGMFKHFLELKGMESVYINAYKARKWKGNPDSIEEFLFSVEPERAMIAAFYFVQNSRFGYDYWTKLQNDWDEYWKNYYDEEHAANWKKLKGHCRGLLAQDWDDVKWYKFCKRAEAIERINGILTKLGREDEVAVLVSTTEEESNASAQVYVEDAKPTEDILDFVDDEDEEDALAGFEDVDTKTRHSARCVLHNDEASVNTRNGKKGVITINQAISNEHRKRGGYPFVRLKVNEANGMVALYFNDVSGVAVLDTQKSRTGQNKTGNVSINSKDFVEKLSKRLGVENKDYYLITLKELSKKDTYVAYVVSLK